MSLSFENITFSYPSIKEQVLCGVSGTIETGKVTALIGNSGSGKSTLGMILKGLIPMDGGVVTLDHSDRSINRLTKNELLMNVGWTPANPEIQIFASSVREEVAFGPANMGMFGDELEQRVKITIEAVGLDYDLFKDRHPLFLSGGEKRLVAIAGVVAMGFKCYIFDEPGIGLDYRAWKSFKNLVNHLTETGAGVCWISHDLKTLKDISGYVVELNNGKLEYSGSSDEFNWDGCLDRMARHHD